MDWSEAEHRAVPLRSGDQAESERQPSRWERSDLTDGAYSLRVKRPSDQTLVERDSSVEVREMAATYNTLYLNARRKLKAAGIPSAQLEAREIVCYVAGKNREEFYRDLTLYASDQTADRIEELTQRRLSGEPVAYIIGEWEFYGLSLDVCRDVLIPRMDTEVLAERAILAARAAGEGCRVLDLCAGSGCVGLAVAANVPECRVVLADVSEGALRVCRQNIRRCELSDRVICAFADAKLPPLPALWDFDVIACNPPYIPTADILTLDVSVKDYEPREALDGGTDGLDFYRTVCSKWKGALRLGGRLLFEVGAGQASDVELLMGQNGFEDIQSFQDTQNIWRVVSGAINE